MRRGPGSVWRENPARGSLFGAGDGDLGGGAQGGFDLEAEDGVTVAARGADGTTYTALSGGSAPVAAMTVAGDGRVKEILRHPVTWAVGAVGVGLVLRKLLGR